MSVKQIVKSQIYRSSVFLPIHDCRSDWCFFSTDPEALKQRVPSLKVWNDTVCDSPALNTDSIPYRN